MKNTCIAARSLTRSKLFSPGIGLFLTARYTLSPGQRQCLSRENRTPDQYEQDAGERSAEQTRQDEQGSLRGNSLRRRQRGIEHLQRVLFAYRREGDLLLFRLQEAIQHLLQLDDAGLLYLFLQKADGLFRLRNRSCTCVRVQTLG